MYADVAVPLAVRQTFTYTVPDELCESIKAGCRALVPFQNRHLIGLVVKLRDEAPMGRYKPLSRILDVAPVLTPTLIDLADWLSRYYFAPPGEVFRIMLPPGLLARKASPDQNPEAFWPVRRQQAVVEVVEACQARLTKRQLEILQHLSEEALPVLVRDLIKEGAATAAILNALQKKGAIRVDAVDLYRSPWRRPRVEEPTRHVLTEEQRTVVEQLGAQIASGGFHSCLVHGVTASGKTEVYLNLIEKTLKSGRTALVLVPEIGLTPQISRHFRGWFGDRVAILHSALSDGERFDQWRRIRRGDAAVVVGTRSAVFAPLGRLGLIIVDEEHDSSYKQNETPRYHGRDTALKRGQLEQALVVMGSATPQLETYHGAVFRKLHQYLPIRVRILERPLPSVHIVDMRSEFEHHGKGSPFSSLLRQMIRERLTRREQVLILLNRRGYARCLLCRSCGNTETCTACSITLTYHQEMNRLTCHYCGYSRSVPTRCRECGKPYVYYVGEGTEKIEEIARLEFPEAVVSRLDRDTSQRRGSLETILEDFAEGRTDILVGTQMIAKGHDFSGVTLVGVLDADAGLKLADFRAAERTFQLVTQVAGRAGRGDQPGEVVIQTYYPNHYSLKYACTQEFLPFSRQELQFRRKFRYPPYSAMVNLLFRDRVEAKASHMARELAGKLIRYRDELSNPSRMRILGPAPAALEKLKNEYRWQVLVKTTSRRELHEVLGRALSDLRGEGHRLERLIVDIDPISLL
ncbi:MAG: primosomal protein N' [Acidobacteriota bacterium]